MSAYFESGFCVRTPSWHRGEILLSDYPKDVDDARAKAGLLWEPEERETYQRLWVPFDHQPLKNTDVVTGNIRNSKGEIIGKTVLEREVLRPLRDNKLIVRNDNENVLGVVGKDFTLVGNGEMFELVETILGQTNVKFETAGSVKGGAHVWALAYLDEPYKLPGDNTETYPFIVVLNSHDGTGATKISRTQIRVVCWNTYSAAVLEGDRHGMQYTIRHTKSAPERIEEAKRALSGARDDAAEWTALATELFGLPVNDAQFQAFVDQFIPEPVGEVVSDRVRSNIDAARKAFKTLYLDSPTNAHQGTALGLVDASVEYLDHVRGYRNRDSYLGRTLLRPEPLKARATKLAREVTAL
jgi:phage/plasmid-like protein (TIGR03299 family)